MKLFALLLVSSVIPACSNRTVAPTEDVAMEAPQTTVYITSRVADPVVDKPVIVQEAQPDAGPTAPAQQPKGHRHVAKRQPVRSRQHTTVQASHGSFHNTTPD